MENDKYYNELFDYCQEMIITNNLEYENKINEYKKIINNFEDKMLCKICFEEKLSICLLPCAHVITCKKCSLNLQHCPTCRKKINTKLNIYLN